MANQLTQFNNSNIQIDSDFFDLDVVDLFSKKPLETLTLEQAREAAPETASFELAEQDIEFSAEDDVDAVIDKVMASLAQDNDIGDTITANSAELKAQSKQNILDSIISKPTEVLIENNQNSLLVNKTVDEDATRFFINGEIVAVIPNSERDSRLAVSVEMIIAWTFLIWHSISFIATVIGFAMPAANNSNVKGVSKTVSTQSSVWSKFIARMKTIAEKISANERVKRFVHAFKVLSLTKNLGAIIKAILTGMSKWRIALAVLDFLASVALLFLSAGAEVIRKMVKMAQLLVNVVQDVVNILDLEKKSVAAQAA